MSQFEQDQTQPHQLNAGCSPYLSKNSNAKRSIVSGKNVQDSAKILVNCNGFTTLSTKQDSVLVAEENGNAYHVNSSGTAKGAECKEFPQGIDDLQYGVTQ